MKTATQLKEITLKAQQEMELLSYEKAEEFVEKIIAPKAEAAAKEGREEVSVPLDKKLNVYFISQILGKIGYRVTIGKNFLFIRWW